MMYYDVLDEIAETHVPSEMHPELHVNCRQAWVETMAETIELGHINGSYEELAFYARFWEQLLYKKYSALN